MNNIAEPQPMRLQTGGPGVDQTESDLTPVTHSYNSPGQHFPVVTVVSSGGRFSSSGGWNALFDRLRINVQSSPVVVDTINIADPVDLKWMPGGFLYVLSRSSATITEYDTSGATATPVRSLSGVGSSPNGLDVDTAGRVYVAVTGNNQVKRFRPTTSSFELDTSFNGSGLVGKPDRSSGSGNGEFNAPFDVAVSPSGGLVAVSDSGNNRIQLFTSSGGFSEKFGATGSALGQFTGPKGLAYGEADCLFITDSGNNRVCIAEPPVVTGASGSGGSGLGSFAGPLGISSGDRGIYVADAGNERIQVFAPAPVGSTPLMPLLPRLSLGASLGLSQPAAVAPVSDLLEERFYIADTGNGRVLLVQLPADDPLPAWENMVARLSAGDLAGAIAYFSRLTAERYYKSFLALGLSEVAADINQIGVLTRVFVRNDEAEYWFEHVVESKILLFRVEFIKENGVWRIMEF